ncbi:MAG: SpoIIE family protein phosphatase [Opitutaceae bacterium]|nr:SpoIIE family protein phosphatase [Opitutaceae bacterium]
MALACLIVAALVVGAALWRLQVEMRHARGLDARVQRLQQEKEMAVRFMQEMVEALSEGVDRPALFQRIVRAAVRCTGAVSGCVYEVGTDERLRGVAVQGLFPPQKPLADAARDRAGSRARFLETVLRSEELALGEGVVGTVAQTRKAECIADGAGDGRLVRHDDPALAVRSLIATPIEFRGRLIGVLAVANPADDQAFTDTDFSLVQSLGVQAGLAVHNIEQLVSQREKTQMDVDMALARSVQMMLVPTVLPHVDGLDVDARYIPAQRVGGDLVDIVPLSADRLAVVVADVSGKGVAASILMAICRTHLRHALEHADSPAEVCRSVNRVMSGEIREGMFVTAVVAIVDAGRGCVTFARAGHEAPLVGRYDAVRGSYVVEPVRCDGMALGLVDPEFFDPAIADCSVPLEVGGMVVLFTDGLTEAPNLEDKEFSTARLIDAVRTHRQAASAEINAGILETVERFIGGSKQHDDLTLVTIKRIG